MNENEWIKNTNRDRDRDREVDRAIERQTDW